MSEAAQETLGNSTDSSSVCGHLAAPEQVWVFIMLELEMTLQDWITPEMQQQCH